MWLWWIADAWARAGGGHTFSSGGGGSSGGGSSGDGGDLGGLLIWLVFRYPAVGIPVLIIVVGFILYSKMNQGTRQVVRTQPRAAAPRANTRGLVERDANFSEPLFLDLARLVYTRAHEERGRNNWGVLTPYLDDSVVKSLERRAPGRPVRDVVLGSARIERIDVNGDVARIRVRFEANLTEGDRKLLVHERWAFLRAADALSPGPERMRALGCPSCGSPVETRSDGRCRSCDNVVTDGRLQFRVGEIEVLSSVPAPPLTLVRGGGVEEGTNLPLVMAPDLPARLRAFQARHPEVRWEDLRARFAEIFQRIQEAWSSGRWEEARPYETDFLFQQHRYWMERYAAEGLRNRLDRVQITDVVPARVGGDAWLESITVRIFARMRDWTEDASGKVVGGSRTEDRIFSEYWTFIRTAGKPARPRAELDNCPSCAAPLDKVNESGVCGYCEAKITGGEFDWVLSAIDQDESYRG